MPTGSTDEAIFGSPDLSEFCCSPEVPTKFPSSYKGQEVFQMCSTSENSATKPRAEENGARKCSQSSATTPYSAESGDDEDILGLISSSLDRFNAQLHHNPQSATSPPIPVNRSEIPVHDIGPAIPTTNFSNSMLSTWAPFAKAQGPPSGLGYSSTSSPMVLQQKSMPSPPGLPRLNQQQQQQQSSTSTSGILKSIGLVDGLPSSQRKKRCVSQTLSDSDETSSLWETHWKALPSDMAMLSVDSGIDGGDLYLMPNWFSNSNNNNATNTNSSVSSCSTSAGGCTGNGMNDCCGGGSTFPPVLNSGNFSPDMDSFPPHSQYQHPSLTASQPPQSFEFPPFDANLIKQAAVIAAAAAQAANEASKGPQPPSDLHPFLWFTPSWPSTADCSPSTETPQVHFRPGDNHHQLTSRFEAALRQQQQQQQSRQLYNRRKADSICFLSAARHNSGLLTASSNGANINGNNRMKSNIGQLGSPPPTGDLCCQQTSKSYGNTPQKFTRDLQQHGRSVGSFGKSSNGVLGAPKMGGQRGAGGGNGRTKRAEATSSISSSSSTSSSETSDKPVIAKWRRACSFYLRGHCKKEDCEFAHDLTKVTCKFWEVGECFKGPTCPFLHGYPPELLLEVQQRQLQQEAQNHPQQQVELLEGN